MLKKYNIIECIGEGNFGKIYKGIHKITKEEVAIKVEYKENDYHLLLNESKIYYLLKNIDGFCNIKWFGSDEKHYYMITNLLGFSISDLIQSVESLSEKIIKDLAFQMLQRIQSLHEIGLIHRDIKPENFLFGIGDNKNQLYLIDFGFCKSYKMENKHIALRKTEQIIGTPNFVSLSVHDLWCSSRKDDLESWVYIILYMLKQIPWNQYSYTKEKNLFIDKKKNIIQEDIK
jgi:serine/threonine protein kinase